MSKALNNDEEPPFPWMAMSSICVGMLAHSVVFTSPLPYVAFMVVDFGMVDNLDEAGYSAGWITGAFMIGRTIAGIPWGIASDTWGRRPCLLLSMLNVAVFGVLFGFSTNFTMAIAFRFFIGLGNGFMGVAKTCVSEIVQTKEHEMKAFGYLNSIWGLGLIVGPALGGLLSRVSVQYPGSVSDDSLWAKYPYLLPCLVCASFAVIAGVWVFVCLPETLGNNRKLMTNEEYKIKQQQLKESAVKDTDLEAGLEEGVEMVTSPMRVDSTVTTSSESSEDSSKSKWRLIGRKTSSRNSSSSGRKTKNGFQALASEDELSDGEEEESESERIIDQKEAETDTEALVGDHSVVAMKTREGFTIDDTEEEDDGEGNAALPEAEEATAVAVVVHSKPKTLNEILYNWDIQIIFCIYMFFCFLVIFIDECFPLWALTSLEKGGLAWESAQVGSVLACVGGALVLYQFLLYQTVMIRYFPHGPTDTYMKLCYISAVAVSFVPFAAYFGLHVMGTKTPDASQHNYVLFVAVSFFLIFYRTSAGSAFTTLGIVVNNSVDQTMRGTMNGLIMTAGSLGNASGPIIGSICYAASLSLPQNLPIPLDGRLMFIVGAMMAVLVGLFARRYMVVN